MSLSNIYGLNLYKGIKFIDNGKSVSIDVPTYDVEIGTGTFDYSFVPDLAIDSSGDLHLVYRKGSDHNTTLNGTIVYRKSTDNGVTWSAESTVVPNDGAILLTNCSITYTSTGRLIVTYSKESGTTRTPYRRYSDDLGDTWSTEAIFSNEYGSGQWVSVTGAIEQVGKRNAVMFSSEDDGDTWTKFGDITPTPFTFTIGGNDPDFEEPTLFRLKSGIWACLLRSDPSPFTGSYMIYSYDLERWSWPKKVSDSRGKNPVCVTPSGTIISVGRNAADWRTLLSYSTDGGKTWTSEYLDAITSAYMYAGVVWSHVINKAIVVYSYQTTGGATTTTGPCNIVCKHISEV